MTLLPAPPPPPRPFVAFGEHFGRGYRSGDAYVYSGVFGMVAGQEAGRLAKT
jgi:hypothetical protein